MSAPILHAIPQWNNLQQGSWDVLICICPTSLIALPLEIQKLIHTRRIVDQRLHHTGPQLIIDPLIIGQRLIIAQVGDLSSDYDDVRVFYDQAEQAMALAIQIGAQRPALWSSGVPQNEGQEIYQYAREATVLGALAALWCPLEARELGRARTMEAVGVILAGDERWHVNDLSNQSSAQRWIHWLQAINAGRCLARDIAGTEPERMAPLPLAKLCQKAFKNTSVTVAINKDIKCLQRDYPLLSAVARASIMVKRHQPCVIRLSYIGTGEINETLLMAGKGVTYDTGGADLKIGGHMAGMSRDKGGAAAVIGLFLTLAHLQPKNLKVVAEIGAVRNSIGADAFVTDEIISSHAGIRVRIGNTDAEGRLVLADLLSHLRLQAIQEKNPYLFTVATLTGHAYRAVGPYSIALDNGPALAKKVTQSLAQAGDVIGECFEISRLRREDIAFVQARTLADDVISCNNEASSATARGHQFPMAFLMKAAGLSAHDMQSDTPLPYTHIDIGGSGVKGGDWQHGMPTAAPLMAMIQRWCPFEP
jgi:leucyl aminopeptidase